MSRRWSFAVCASLAALGVGLLPSPGFAFGDGNTSGGTTNGGSSSGGGSTNTVSGSYAKFYDATVNGSACPPGGVSGTAGGVFGTARVTAGAPSTVTIKVHRLSHTTAYTVNVVDSTCAVTPLGTLTTDGHGRGGSTFSFKLAGPGSFTLVPAAGDSFQTKNVSF